MKSHGRRQLARVVLMLIVLSACSPWQAPGRSSAGALPPTQSQKDYLEPKLREDVERLKADVSIAPTTLSNYDARARTVWAWGNAAAKVGFDMNPAFPSAMAAVRRPDFGTTATDAARRASFETLDEVVKELGWREANPASVGRLTTPTPGPFIADSYTTITQVYQVGSKPMTPGGGILFTPYIYIGGVAFQADDPRADNYLSVKASRPGVRFELDSKLVRPIMSGAITGAARERPFFRLVEGRLESGDTATIVIGDTSGGSRGYLVPNFQTSGLRMKVWARLDPDGPDIVLPEQQFPIIGRPETVSVRGFAPSILATGECTRVSVRSEDRYRNRSSGVVPGYVLTADGAAIAQLAPGGAAVQHADRICFTTPGVKRITIRSLDGRLAGDVNPVLVQDNPATRLYWGETHGHSGFAEGNGTVDGYYTFARDDAGLDFAGLSEHDLWMDDFEWEALRSGAKRFLKEGEFISLLAYEWTQQSTFGGHHNVFFRTPDGRSRVGVQEAPTLDPLYRRLKQENAAEDVLVIPHAHMAGDYTKSDDGIERMVEIASNHGAFEWFGRAYLGEGRRVGFLGGSDSHTEHPGLRVLRSDVAQSDFPGGLAAVFAPARTTDAIFSALRDRLGYATNGARIILMATVNDSTVRTARVQSTTRISGIAAGTAPINTITLIKNGREIATRDFLAAEGASGSAGTLELSLFSDTNPKAVRTASRETRDWSGIVTVRGARLVSVSAPGHDNVFTESLRRDGADANRVDFRLRTHGAPKDIRLVLDRIQPGATVRVQGEAGLGYSRANTDKSPFDETIALSKVAQGRVSHSISTLWPEDQFSLRYISPNTLADRNFTFEDAETPKAGDYYYVRVTQADGGIAWSSATWLEP